MKMDFDFDSFFKGLEWSKEVVQNGAEEGMDNVTKDLLQESRDLAPLSEDGGQLRSTAGKSVESTNRGVTGEVFFTATEETKSGEIVNYALITHELGESFKNPTTPGTQPKYLERPLKENADKYKRMVADAIRKELS